MRQPEENIPQAVLRMVNWSRVGTVFLDMDGTLLDLHFDNYFWLEHLPRRYAQRHGIGLQQARDTLVPMIMAEKGSLNWYCTDYWSNRLSLDVTALKAEISDRIAWRPHVRDFLRALRRARLHTVVVTNCHPEPLALKLRHTGLERYVDRIVSSHQLGRPKEDPDFWPKLHALAPYPAAETLLIDDSLPVLASARTAGIGQCLAVLAPDSRQPPRPAPADFPGIHHFDEVLPALRKHLPTATADRYNP